MKIFLAVIFLILAIIFWRYLLYGVIGATLLGFIGSQFSEGGMVFGGLVGFLLGLIAARNNSKNTAEILPFKQTEVPLETKRKSILRKLGLSSARNNSENTTEISPFKQTEAPLEMKRKSILRKTRDALVGFALLAIVVVGLAVSFTPKPKSISPFDVIGVFSPMKYIIKKWRK